MNNLIVPCAGGRKIGNLPLYLNRHPVGSIVLRRALDGLVLSNFDRIIISIVEKDDERYHASDIIKKELCDIENIEICLLKEETAGAADTVFLTIQEMNLDGHLVIKDVTNRVIVPQLGCENFIVGLNISTFKKDVHDLKNKSYISVNDQRQVLDIIEKQIKSECIGVGLYGLQVKDFVMAYMHLKDESYAISRLYISHVVAYLMGYSEKIFHYIEAKDFESWSDEKSWGEVQSKYALIVADLDAIISEPEFDSKGLWSILNSMSDDGAMIIGVTSKTEEGLKRELGDIRETQRIKFIFECNYTMNKSFIASYEELRYKFYMR